MNLPRLTSFSVKLQQPYLAKSTMTSGKNHHHYFKLIEGTIGCNQQLLHAVRVAE
jgi:hypothetical protein